MAVTSMLKRMVKSHQHIAQGVVVVSRARFVDLSQAGSILKRPVSKHLLRSVHLCHPPTWNLEISEQLIQISDSNSISGCRTWRMTYPYCEQLIQIQDFKFWNLEDDVSVEESRQDETPVLGTPNYWRRILQRPKRGSCGVAHLKYEMDPTLLEIILNSNL